ncbi:UNKNOWN [Stylonychia lemnae]|uniref:Uncharacterized protein n=1 Tax=Stylonychia lemnae TaxID=5949 RepID=A0A078BAX6_STYLE|nr:UNKNOWN [Stylonychia lemnae]|eukprot:CDW91539.1 UNKNOWN [Stylonychia lemnae]
MNSVSAFQLLGIREEQAENLEMCMLHNFKKIYVCLYGCNLDPEQIAYCIFCKKSVDDKQRLVHDHKDEYIHVIAKEMSNSYYEIRGKYEQLIGKFDGSYSDQQGLFTKYSDLLEYLKIKKEKMRGILPQNQNQEFQLDKQYTQLKKILEKLQDLENEVNNTSLTFNANKILAFRRKWVDMNEQYVINFQFLEDSITEEIWNSFRDVFMEGDLSDIPELNFDNFRFFTGFKEKATKIFYETRLKELQMKQNEQEQKIRIMKEKIKKLFAICGE